MISQLVLRNHSGLANLIKTKALVANMSVIRNRLKDPRQNKTCVQPSIGHGKRSKQWLTCIHSELDHRQVYTLIKGRMSYRRGYIAPLSQMKRSISSNEDKLLCNFERQASLR